MDTVPFPFRHGVGRAVKPLLGTCVMESLLSANDYAKLGVKRDEFDVSPKVSLLYHWSGDVTTYAGWARGYKSGGIKSISLNPDSVVETWKQLAS